MHKTRYVAPRPVPPPDCYIEVLVRQSLADVRLVGLEHALWSHFKNPFLQHLYIKNENSGPTIHIRQWIPFITEIFVAFSCTLAEEVMCLCRRAQTKLYIFDVKVKVLDL